MNNSRYETYSNDELLREYHRTRDNSMKQELVMRYSYMVKTIALQMRGVYISFTEVDDIISEGIIALMGAIEKFDPSKGVKLETYASLRIKGTIVDLARKQDWIPRSIRKKAREIDDATMELYTKLGRMPEDKEVAEYMDLPLEKFYKIQGDMNLYNVVSLDSLVTEYQDSVNASPLSGFESLEGMPVEFLQKKELSGVLVDAIKSLNQREQLIVSLYYRKELSMKEIASILQVSEPRVSQLHSAALRKLRAALSAYKTA